VRAPKIVLWVVVLIFPRFLLAGDAVVPCDRHTANSEFSWNPSAQFVTPRLQRFYDLQQNIESAYRSGNDDGVKTLSSEYLHLALSYRCNWNYGNAIHDANRYLGLVSLRNRNAGEAVAFLRLSGKTPGSPQLNSFGPDLDLAVQLLKRGEVNAVTQYLTDIKVFWKMDGRGVDRWLAAIARGEKPKLDRFSAKMSSPWFQFAGWAWPEMIVLGFLYVVRKRLSRKLLFVIAGSATVYAASYRVACVAYLISWAWNSYIPEIPSQVQNLSNYSGLLLFSTTLLGFGIPVLAVFALTRFWNRGSALKPG
jgi:hypothetical protein